MMSGGDYGGEQQGVPSMVMIDNEEQKIMRYERVILGIAKKVSDIWSQKCLKLPQLNLIQK